MSKDIVVRDSDYQPSYLNGVKRIRTELQDGGLCNWVPEDELFDVIEKRITENGIHIAAEDNASGYSIVIVDVKGGGGGGTRSPRADALAEFAYDDSIWQSSVTAELL